MPECTAEYKLPWLSMNGVLGITFTFQQGLKPSGKQLKSNKKNTYVAVQVIINRLQNGGIITFQQHLVRVVTLLADTHEEKRRREAQRSCYTAV